MTQPQKPPAPPVTVNLISFTDARSINRFLSGIAHTFTNTPLSRAFITEIDNTPPPYPSPTINPARLLTHTTPGITKSAHDGAELIEAGDFSALAVWETTTYRGVAFSEQLKEEDVKPIRREWRRKLKNAKEQHIGLQENGELRPFYHLAFLARNLEVQPAVPGAVTAVVKPWLERAVSEGVPVWLEATYEHAVEVYGHWGFRLVEEVVVGVGVRNEEGWPEVGGVGTRGFCMIYDGHLKAQGLGR